MPQEAGTISGIVEDETGKPVPNAKVHIAEKAAGSAHRAIQMHEADSNGKFTISHVPWGTYVVMAGKESDGYPDTLTAFYSNLKIPTVTLGPLFPTASVIVHIGPRAGLLDIASVVDAITGKSLLLSSSVTLRHADNPNFFISTSTSAKDIMVPSQTAVTIEIDARGYRPWPEDKGRYSYQINLQPKEVFTLRVRLESESGDPTVGDLVRELGERNKKFFTLEEGQKSDEMEGQMRFYRLPRPARGDDIFAVLDYMSLTVPNFSYQFDKKDARIIHIVDRRLAGQKEYALEQVTQSIDFTAAVQNLLRPIAAGGKVPVVWMLAPASDDLLPVDLDKKVTAKIERLNVREALSEILPLPDQGGILWRSDTEIGMNKMSVITLCCVHSKK
ncbi:MAG TPA: carboxypeptidase-like regulatory domain-containing protein [Candidatus Angelobacter sp.]|nr:carboxypeptidase-like regulatory domain-containing protein [Candidatus Angelobacter sp.]